MELTISEDRAKVLLKEVFSTAIMRDAIEDIGLSNAIREGRQNEFVSEDEILAILRG